MNTFSKMTVSEIQKEMEVINTKMQRAYIDDLSAEEYGKLLDRKLELMHELFNKTFNKETRS